MTDRPTFRRLSIQIAAVLTMGCFLAITAGASELPKATHKQIRKIKPQQDGKPVRMTTFCLDPTGNLLVCCAAVPARSTVRTKANTSLGMIQVYSPEGKLVKVVQLDFVPSAINVSPGGQWFAAGSGNICKLDSEGKVLSKARMPHLRNPEALRKEMEEAAKEQVKRMLKAYSSQMKIIADRVKKITDVAEDQRTDLQKSQLKMLQSQQGFYKTQLERMKKSGGRKINIEAMLRSKTRVTGLAVNDHDVFVAISAIKGYGYDVWCMDHQFKNPTKVIESLRGCCGQMDIQCHGDRLVVADNTKFQVTEYDRNGKRLDGFGKRDRKSVDGFGSCCNPMNVFCCSNGDILTAESSIGNIKRFRGDGQFLAYVGKAKIGGGCKHCAIAWDEKRDRVYLQHEDQHYICVLVPMSEAPEFTEDELAAKQAMEGLGKKLVGKWEKVPSGKKATTRTPGMLGSRPSAVEMEFSADGSFAQKMSSKSSVRAVRQMQWRAVKQEGNTLTIALVTNQIDGMTMRITFTGDDQAKFESMYGTRVYGSAEYQRGK